MALTGCHLALVLAVQELQLQVVAPLQVQVEHPVLWLDLCQISSICV